MSMLAVFMEFYEKLTALPIDDMIEKLYANNLLPGDHKDKVQSPSLTPKEKAQHFLDGVIRRSLEIGYTEQFEKLISIMELSDDPALKHLAKKIRERSLNLIGKPAVCTPDYHE